MANGDAIPLPPHETNLDAPFTPTAPQPPLAAQAPAHPQAPLAWPSAPFGAVLPPEQPESFLPPADWPPPAEPLPFPDEFGTSDAETFDVRPFEVLTPGQGGAYPGSDTWAPGSHPFVEEMSPEPPLSGVGRVSTRGTRTRFAIVGPALQVVPSAQLLASLTPIEPSAISFPDGAVAVVGMPGTTISRADALNGNAQFFVANIGGGAGAGGAVAPGVSLKTVVVIIVVVVVAGVLIYITVTSPATQTTTQPPPPEHPPEYYTPLLMNLHERLREWERKLEYFEGTLSDGTLTAQETKDTQQSIKDIKQQIKVLRAEIREMQGDQQRAWERARDQAEGKK